LAVTADGKFFASTSHVGHVSYGEIGARDFIAKKIVEGSARGVAISPDGKTLAISDFDGSVRLLDITPKK